MGAWGHGVFDNDDAADWVMDLEDTQDLSLLIETLDRSLLESGEGLDAPQGSCILAAAEVLCALLGRPSAALQEEPEVMQWLEDVPDDEQATASALIPGALALVDAVVAPDSELTQLWTESGNADPWLTVVQDLRVRLSA